MVLDLFLGEGASDLSLWTSKKGQVAEKFMSITATGLEITVVLHFFKLYCVMALFYLKKNITQFTVLCCTGSK